MQGRIFVYASVLVTLTLCSLFQFACTARTDDNEKQKSSSVMKTFLAGEDPTKVRQVSPSGNCPTCPVIKSVTLIPEQPTILDNIKAVLSLDREAPPNTKFEYKWLINEKPYDTEKGDTLPAGSFKKRDSVAVDVTPILDGKRGSTSQAYFRVIHSAFPSFALKEGNNRAGEVIELQLIGQDPDADKITYALEKPFLEGMTVDKNTGKITWNPADRIKGTYRFTASATDSDGTKTVKTFEFSLNTK